MLSFPLKSKSFVSLTVLALVATAAVITGSIALTRPAVSAEAATTASSSKILRTSGSKIIDAQGNIHTIKAISWFGMETDKCAPHGLWQINLKSGLETIKDDGFNTVRLPYSNDCLHASKVNNVDANPDLVNLTPLQLMDTFIKDANAEGLDVILDQHRPDTSAQSPLWYSSDLTQAQWISDWRMLAKRYQGQSNVIGADLHNEPAGNACWGCGDPSRDWQAAAQTAGNSILAVNPHWLIIVEGVQYGSQGQNTWLGGGLWDAAKYPVKLSVANKLVYSVHDYPSSVYPVPWFSDPSYPNNLPGVWDANFGYLVKQNIAPVFIGEFGTKLETTSDKQWLNSLVSYIHSNGFSFGYWDFNPDSGDTGGIVQDDWISPETAKLDALQPILTEPTTSVPPQTTSSPTLRATATPGPIIGAFPSTGSKLAAAYTVGDVWSGGYNINLTLTGSASSWSASWKAANVTSVSAAWGETCSLSSGTITCKGADWGATVSPGQPLTVGLTVNAPNGPLNQVPAVTVASS